MWRNRRLSSVHHIGELARHVVSLTALYTFFTEWLGTRNPVRYKSIFFRDWFISHITSLLQYAPCGVREESDVIGLKVLDNTRLKYDHPATVGSPAIINEK